jgi:O-methyltransferase
MANALRALYRKIAPERAQLMLSIIRQTSRLRGADLIRTHQAISAHSFTEMQGLPITFFEDGLATTHNCDFVGDPRFVRALTFAEQTNSWKGWPLRWRAYVVCWCAEYARRLPGDFVECGVNKGGYARMIIDYVGLGDSGKSLYLFDTFKGFVPELLRPEEAGMIENYNYSDCLEEVQKTFAPFPFVDIVEGPVPQTLPSREIEAVCFLSIDMNCVAPEIAAAEYFWPKMVDGAVMVLDDYGHSLHVAQKTAFDDFAKKHGVSVLCMPTGQGLIFKP